MIAESAKVMVKGDSIAYRVPVRIYSDQTRISAYVPLDIESTSTFALTVGPNGEETAVVVKDENDIPKVKGIGTISITMTKTGEKKTVIAENDGSLYTDKAYEMEDILLLDTDGEPGAIQGTVVNVQDNQPIADIRVLLRKGMNNITSNAVAECITDSEGTFSFDEVTPGQYTVQLVDDSENFMRCYENISVLANGTSTKTMYMSQKLDSEAVRFVLTWGNLVCKIKKNKGTGVIFHRQFFMRILIK